MSLTTTVDPQDVLRAADHLIAAFAATDGHGYFDCFTADASFVFHAEPGRLDDRAAYERLWASWVDAGWRVVSCDSSQRLVQVYGNTAVFSHTVDTVTDTAGQRAATRERETIVFVHAAGRLLAVHEHLSPVPPTA
jgi:ketosteroid isomerase-like protein